ncbi:hypothetical protein SDC9_146540 [bioreactor metagenome]|uniref:Uncharacterized protein n=2 Tax=root TaxID=1 RepID=A0A645EDE2_9ZZZZ
MMDAESGKIGKTEILKFCIVNIIANFVAWVIVAPVLDIVIYSEPVNLVFAQGVVAFILDAICACVIGSLLLVAYAKTKTSKGSLTKD